MTPKERSYERKALISPQTKCTALYTTCKTIPTSQKGLEAGACFNFRLCSA